MSDTNERSCASRGSLAMRETFRVRVQAGLFDFLKSIHTANVLLETVILPALDDVPTLTDEEREALAKGIYLCEGTAGEANENINGHAWAQVAARLRGLLERAK